MKTKRKTSRLISFLLTVCMLLSLIPSFGMTAFASDTTVVSDVSFTLGFHKESRETRKLRDYLTTDYYYEDVKDIIYYMITENPPGCDDYYSSSMISIKYKTRDGYYKNVEEEYSEMLSAYTQYYLCFIFRAERGKVFARNPTVNISDPLGMLPDGVLNNIEVVGIDEQNVVYIYVPLPVTGDGFEISYTTDLACHNYLTNNFPPYDIHAPDKFYTKLYPMGLVGTGTNGGTKEQEADVAFKTLSGERIPGGSGCDDCLYLYINNRGAAQLDTNYTTTLVNTDDFRIISTDLYTNQDGVVSSTRPLAAGSYFRYYYARIYPTVTTPGTYTTDVYIDATTEGRPLPRITLHCSVTILGAEDRVDIICYDDPDFNGMFTTDGDTTEICREYKNIMCNGNAERLFYLSDNATVPVAYYESNACIAWKDSSSGRFYYFNEGSLYASPSFPPPANTKPQLYYSFRVYPAEGKVFSNNTKFYLNYREADEEDFIVDLDDSLHYATVFFKATPIIDRVYTSGLSFTKTSAKDMTSYEGTEFTPSFTSVINNNSGTVKAYSYEWGCEQIGGTGRSTIIVDKNTGIGKIYPGFYGNCRVWMKQVIDYEVNYITYRFKSSEVSRDYPVQRRGYDLRINSADAHVIRIPASGEETQLGVELNIYDIIYVPEDGYYFQEDYGQGVDGNGLTLRRDNNTQMVVTGVLDGNTEITLPPAAAMSPQDAPGVIGGDMSIGKTTANMQYRTGNTLWQMCSNVDTTVSSAGIYEVRLKETATQLAGAITKVAVYNGSDTTSYAIHYDLNGGAYLIPPAFTITETHKAGDTFQLLATKLFNYADHRFVGWSDGVKVYKANASYTMPSWPVTFVAQWRSTTVQTDRSVSGTFTSFGDATKETTIQLIPQDGSAAPAPVKVTGTSGTYTISNVAPGTYTLQVSKANHVTREYEITVGSEAVTQDVKICLKGDVNGDGKINSTDALWIRQKSAGSRTFDEYQNKLGDVNGDGKINSTDALWIRQVSAGSRTLS